MNRKGETKMKQYMEPEIEIAKFRVEDVITTSDEDLGEGGLPIRP